MSPEVVESRENLYAPPTAEVGASIPRLPRRHRAGIVAIALLCLLYSVGAFFLFLPIVGLLLRSNGAFHIDALDGIKYLVVLVSIVTAACAGGLSLLRRKVAAYLLLPNLLFALYNLYAESSLVAVLWAGFLVFSVIYLAVLAERGWLR